MGAFHRYMMVATYNCVNYRLIYVSTCLPHLPSFVKKMSEMHRRHFKDRHLVITHLYMYIYMYICAMHYYTHSLCIYFIYSVIKNLLSS